MTKGYLIEKEERIKENIITNFRSGLWYPLVEKPPKLENILNTIDFTSHFRTINLNKEKDDKENLIELATEFKINGPWNSYGEDSPHD